LIHNQTISRPASTRITYVRVAHPAAVPVHARPDLGHHLRHSQATVAPETTRPVWRSRSSFWSAEDTRQYATTRPDSTASGWITSHRPVAVWITGIWPFLAHSHPVW
jgi:hypothetical protein